MADLSELGKISAELIDSLEESLPDDVKIGTVAIIVEVALRVDEDGTPVEGDHNVSDIIYRCSDRRRWIQAGLMRQAARRAEGLLHQR